MADEDGIKRHSEKLFKKVKVSRYNYLEMTSGLKEKRKKKILIISI